MTTYEEHYMAQYNKTADANIVLTEALQKIDSLSDYDEDNEWTDMPGLLESISDICAELRRNQLI